MRHSFWPDGSYPQFVNPEFDELVELANHKWDTVRILVDEEDLVLGSGYGNTHTTLAKAARVMLKTKRFLGVPYILYHEQGRAYFNMTDVSGQEREPALSGLKEFSARHKEVLRELIKLSDLSL